MLIRQRHCFNSAGKKRLWEDADTQQRQCCPTKPASCLLGRVRKRPLHNCARPSLTPLMAPQFVEEVILSVGNNRTGEAQRSIRPAYSSQEERGKKSCLCTVGKVEKLHSPLCSRHIQPHQWACQVIVPYSQSQLLLTIQQSS